MLYLIYKNWIDPMENSISAAKGKDLIGYTEHKVVADSYSNCAEVIKGKDTWWTKEDYPVYEVQQVDRPIGMYKPL